MTNPNGYSDSQESLKAVLLDDAAFHELQDNIDGMDGLLDSTIMETEQKCALMYSQIPQPINIPVLDEFAGRYNFQLVLNHQSTSKHCMYSKMLEKIFINMEQALPLRFEWSPPVDDLYVRTTMVFALDQYRGDPVVRCHNHMALPNLGNAGVKPEVLKYVVRCLNPASIYDESGSHLSVLVPLGTPQAGSNYVPLNFQFYCKNSCASGMNRRPTELIFTLETHDGQVLGRRRLSVRVCSCPKRDKDKEEEAHLDGKDHVGGGKKRKLSVPSGKKLMTMQTVGDNRDYLVQFKIPGKDNYQAVLKFAYDLMAGQAMRTGQPEPYLSYMEDLAQKLQCSQ